MRMQRNQSANPDLKISNFIKLKPKIGSDRSYLTKTDYSLGARRPHKGKLASKGVKRKEIGLQSGHNLKSNNSLSEEKLFSAKSKFENLNSRN